MNKIITFLIMVGLLVLGGFVLNYGMTHEGNYIVLATAMLSGTCLITSLAILKCMRRGEYIKLSEFF